MATRQSTRRGRRVLGCDPGKVDFGWAIYGPDGLERHGIIDGAETVDDLRAWRPRFHRLLDLHKPNVVIIERYARRPGRGATKSLEVMNLMIGMAIESALSRGMGCHIVTAASHKGWTSRTFGLEKRELSTNEKRRKVKRQYDLSDYEEWKPVAQHSMHEVDACNVAKYGYDVIWAFDDNDNDNERNAHG